MSVALVIQNIMLKSSFILLSVVSLAIPVFCCLIQQRHNFQINDIEHKICAENLSRNLSTTVFIPTRTL